jgi:transposase
MKPYSLDFRQKVVEAYEAGGISQRQLAENFRVTLSFVQGLLKRKRELGTIMPKIRTEQTPTKLNAAQLDVLRQLVEAQPDATLAEFQERLHQKTDVFIAIATVDRMIRLKLKLTLKKKSLSQQKRNGRGSTGSI